MDKLHEMCYREPAEPLVSLNISAYLSIDLKYFREVGFFDNNSIRDLRFAINFLKSVVFVRLIFSVTFDKKIMEVTKEPKM